MEIRGEGGRVLTKVGQYSKADCVFFARQIQMQGISIEMNETEIHHYYPYQIEKLVFRKVDFGKVELSAQ